MTIAWSDQLLEVLHALEPVFVVLDRLHRMDAVGHQRQEVRQAEGLVQRQQLLWKLLALDRKLPVELEDVVREPRLAFEVRGIDGIDPDQVLLLERVAPGDVLRADGVLDAVVVAVVAVEGAVQRVELDELVPVFLDYLVHLGAERRGGLRLRGAQLLLRGRTRTGGERREEQDQENTVRSHRAFPLSLAAWRRCCASIQRSIFISSTFIGTEPSRSTSL